MTSQVVCRIPAHLAPSLATHLKGVRPLHASPPKGEAIFLGRLDSGDRVEVRRDGTFTYERSEALKAILIQGLKSILPPPPARYVLGIDEAGIGGESRSAVVAGVLSSTDIRAELIVEGVRDGKAISSRDELERVAQVVRVNAIYAVTKEVPLPPPGTPFAKACAEAAASLIDDLFQKGYSTDGLAIRIDQTDVETLARALGPLWESVKPLTVVETGAEKHLEVAAAGILAKMGAAAIPAARPPRPHEKATAPFSIGRWREEDKDQIITFLRRLDLAYPDIVKWIDRGGKPDAIWGKVTSNDYSVTVARFGDEVAGFCMTQKKDDRNHKMSTFYVAPPYRKQYVGPSLLREELRRLARADCRRLMVTFGHEEFHTMQPFFAKFGFTCDGISPQRYRDNSYEVVMAKRFHYGVVDADAFPEFVKLTLFRTNGYDIEPLDDTTFFATPKQALFAFHQFEPQGRFLVKTCVSERPEEELAQHRTLAKQHGARPVFASLYGFPSEAPPSPDVLDAHTLENQFYPLRLHRPSSEDLVIPIRPEYAAQLFPERSQTTFGPAKLGLRAEHVYYRTDRGGRNLRRGARLFWYVSGAKQHIIGAARVREVLRGAPAKLFARYGGLGAWHEEDIEEHVGGESAMALVFEWFRPALTRPSLNQIRSIKPDFNPITMVAITHEQGNQLLQAAGL